MNHPQPPENSKYFEKDDDGLWYFVVHSKIPEINIEGIPLDICTPEWFIPIAATAIEEIGMKFIKSNPLLDYANAQKHIDDTDDQIHAWREWRDQK